MTRKYELKERARRQEETRQRIVEATVELHGSLGPAHTTISAIAERAGVQRLTVYRHFPDELSLFRACSGHWRAEHPLPDMSRWAAIPDPEERLGEALREIYAYFRATEDMTALVLRDFAEVDAIQTVAAPTIRYWADVRELLERGWAPRGRRRARRCERRSAMRSPFRRGARSSGRRGSTTRRPPTSWWASHAPSEPVLASATLRATQT